MSLKRLALVGDALWGQVAVEVLIVAGLDKMEISKPDKPGPLAAYKSLLTTNVVAASLARSTGLLALYNRSSATDEAAATIWEAYLAALFLQQGRRSLLEYLAPIMKIEFEQRFDAQKQPESVASVDPQPKPVQEARVAIVTEEITKKEGDLKRIRELPKTEPVIFASLDSAKNDFRSTLDVRKIPYLITFSPSNSRATLQLPGAPLIAVKTTAISTNRKQSLLSKLARQAVSQGYFILAPSKTGKSTNPPAPKATPPHDVASTNPPRCPLAKGPLLFVSLDAAIKSFFIELTERKIKHNYSPVVEGRRTLRISGITRIVSKGDDEKEFRRALVESAIRLGIVKLESSASSTKSTS